MDDHECFWLWDESDFDRLVECERVCGTMATPVMDGQGDYMLKVLGQLGGSYAPGDPVPATYR